MDVVEHADADPKDLAGASVGEIGRLSAPTMRQWKASLFEWEISPENDI